MKENTFFSFLHKQIPVMTMLSLGPGLGYIFLGYIYNFYQPAIVWYLCIVSFSIWGSVIYRKYDLKKMTESELSRWYKRLIYYYYGYFMLWVFIFIIYVSQENIQLHYIAIFTELGTAVVAATLLNSDKKLYLPLVLISIMPLTVYFILSGEWHGYVLSAFSLVFAWVLIYGANSSNKLLMQSSYNANHDMLTGMFNRHYYINYLQTHMNTINQFSRYSHILLIDLDHFKTINDTLGHDVGDRLLREVSGRISDLAPMEILVARLGGDEFIVTGPFYDNAERCQEDALAFAENLNKRLKETYVLDKHHLYISCSIGISIIKPGQNDANQFIKEADIAMYEVKGQGRDGVFVFNEDMSRKVERHIEIERELYAAIRNKVIHLNFQPQFDNKKFIRGVEVLARWDNKKWGSISPSEFIPIAEQTGLIVELGLYIFEKAVRQLKDWLDRGLELEQFSVNISKRQLYSQNFTTDMMSILDSVLSPAEQQLIILEITESVVAEDIERFIEIIVEFKKKGIRFSMDDFGTGYSSLGYLKRLPIDEVKIDRQFVKELTSKERDQEMLRTILNMANVFNLTTVAEGVETEEQLEFLISENCEMLQGNLLSLPLSASEFEERFITG